MYIFLCENYFLLILDDTFNCLLTVLSILSNKTVSTVYSDSTIDIDALISNAVDNERILRRFQSFELHLLDCDTLDNMLCYLLLQSPAHFDIQGVELCLYDPHGIIEELIPEDASYLPYVRFLRDLHSLELLYGEAPQVQLLNRSLAEEHGVLKQYFIQSAAILPLERHGVLVGSLHFGAEKASRYSQGYSTEFITHLAAIVAVCLENTINQDRLTRLSMIDMLTKVNNRRAFHLSLLKEISRACRTKDPLSLLVIDLDFFKKINDQYGHLTGDKVLKEVAQFIDKMQRRTDHLCRYGGEEFVLVLPNCHQLMACEIAERIRQAVSELIIKTETGETISVTLSMGVATWNVADYDQSKIGKDAEQEISKQLIAIADAGVYQAKEAGRNQVCCDNTMITL